MPEMQPVLVLQVSDDGNSYSWRFVQGGPNLPPFTLAAAAVHLHKVATDKLTTPPGPAVTPAASEELARLLRERNGK